MTELWINGARFAHEGVREMMTGAQIRALPLPSIRDGDDLFLIGRHGQEDQYVELDEAIRVAGREFFTAPKAINAG